MFHLRYIGHSYGVPFVNTYECRSTETDQFHKYQIGYVFAVMRWKLTVILNCDNIWLYYLSLTYDMYLLILLKYIKKFNSMAIVIITICL